jgi:AmpD protein
MQIDAAGFVDAAQFIRSPNCDERPADSRIELLVIHNISLPPGQFGGSAICDLFLNRLDPGAHPYFRAIAERRVSAHFLIRRDATLLQFVPCAQRAWHAGESNWRGRARCNDFSIGIELEGTDECAFEDGQYSKLAQLARALKSRYPIVESVGHADIAPGRKTDPGPHFDWARYVKLVGA